MSASQSQPCGDGTQPILPPTAEPSGRVYGDLPEDLGLIDLSPTEMMFWLYCPVLTPTSLLTIPPNLRWTRPIVEAALDREWSNVIEPQYVYLTAKTLWISEGADANRPGWHADGFGTNDVNYVWYDRAPTEFVEDSYTLPSACDDSMAIMAARADRSEIITYPDKHLLRLTPSVVHRVPEGIPAGYRSFVKVSISPDRYNLEGNSINHALGETWPMLPRRSERNHPHDTAERSVLAREDQPIPPIQEEKS